MKSGFRCLALIGALIALAAGPAAAQVEMAYIDYYGFGHETNGFPASEPGDELVLKCVADYADPAFEVDLEATELTFYISGLISLGATESFDGSTMIQYTGGSLAAYTDASHNADWSALRVANPAPTTFNDGDLFLRGDFSSFYIIMTAAGDGVFEGQLQGLEGEALGEPCTGCAYTWGGAFTLESGAQIPDGYHMQVDGEFEIDAALPHVDTTWGQLKTLYR